MTGKDRSTGAFQSMCPVNQNCRMQLKLGAESSTVAQDHLMAELKRVGTQQEVLRKAVAEAAAEAHAEGQSFSVSPLPGFVEPGKRDKGGGQIAAPDGPGIQAKWTDSPSPSRQGSQDAAVSQTDSAAVQMAEAAEMNNRAESLQDCVDQISDPSGTVEAPQAAPPTAEPKRSTLAPELITQAGVAASRSALARMQVALGGHDDSGKAAFDPAQYTFDKLPSQHGMNKATVTSALHISSAHIASHTAIPLGVAGAISTSYCNIIDTGHGHHSLAGRNAEPQFWLKLMGMLFCRQAKHGGATA